MKTKDMIPLFAVIGFGFFPSEIAAQEFNGNISGTFGILNTKIRFQFELPIKERASSGLNLNYYFKDWTGPLFEPFFRVYGKGSGNIQGFFGQFKLIYGNLKTIGNPYPDAFTNKRWSTYGFGLNVGYKFLFKSNITIEPLTGIRLLSMPVYQPKPGMEVDCDEMKTGYREEWIFSTGFPIDFQIKFGVQF